MHVCEFLLLLFYFLYSRSIKNNNNLVEYTIRKTMKNICIKLYNMKHKKHLNTICTEIYKTEGSNDK